MSLYPVTYTRISDGADDDNNFSGSSLIIGNIALAGDQTHRAVFRVDLSAIASGTTVTSATLTIPGGVDWAGATQTYTANRIVRAPVLAQTTWNNYSTSGTWTTAGASSNTGDYTATGSDSFDLTLAAAENLDPVVFDGLATMAQYAVNNNSGILFIRVTGPGDSLTSVVNQGLSNAGFDAPTFEALTTAVASALEAVCYQVNGSAVTGGTYTGLKPNGAAGSTKVNTGTIRNGGTIAGSLLVNNTLGEENAPIGNVVVNSSAETSERRVTSKAVSAGEFAYQVAGQYVMRRHSTTIGGVANTVLQSGGSDNGRRRAIHQLTGFRYVDVLGFSWQSNSNGAFIVGVNKDGPGASIIIEEAADDFEVQNSSATEPASQTNDIAANPSRTYPGQLVYKSPKMTLDTYAPKTS